MDNFKFYSPTYFVFGRGRQHETGKYVKKFKGKKVLIHFGGGSAERSGLLGDIRKSLKDEGIDFVELGGVQPNPRSELVYKGIDLCRTEKVDFILAVGGGSVIDSAKAIALGVPFDGDFWSFFGQKGTVTEALPVGVVLTISAAGSEGSPDTVISHENGALKMAASGEVLRPMFAILNPELTASLPAYQVACGGADIMAHVFERYFTNSKEVEVTDRLCEGILLTMLKELPKAVKNPADYEAQANIMWAGTLAHNNVVGVGRVQDWASHGLEHELSAKYDVAHGAGLAVIFPAWMTYVVDHDIERFVQLATRVFGVDRDNKSPKEIALEGIAKLKAFWKSLGLPVNFKELGADPKDIPYMAGHIAQKRGNFVVLDQKDFEEIYKLAV